MKLLILLITFFASSLLMADNIDYYFTGCVTSGQDILSGAEVKIKFNSDSLNLTTNTDGVYDGTIIITTMSSYAQPQTFLLMGDNYPNPFNPNTAVEGKLKFENVVPGSLITIYTLSGEVVTSLNAKERVVVKWDCTNRYGSLVSSGIYFYIIHNIHTNSMHKGKIFVVNN